jgi:hypothetical protein
MLIPPHHEEFEEQPEREREAITRAIAFCAYLYGEAGEKQPSGHGVLPNVQIRQDVNLELARKRAEEHRQRVYREYKDLEPQEAYARNLGRFDQYLGIGRILDLTDEYTLRARSLSDDAITGFRAGRRSVYRTYLSNLWTDVRKVERESGERLAPGSWKERVQLMIERAQKRIAVRAGMAGLWACLPMHRLGVSWASGLAEDSVVLVIYHSVTLSGEPELVGLAPQA